MIRSWRSCCCDGSWRSTNANTQHLFTELIYDVDTRRFVRFRLKPWADRFLLIRMDLYYEMFGDLEGEKDDSTDILGQWNPVPHRGIGRANRSNARRWPMPRMYCARNHLRASLAA